MRCEGQGDPMVKGQVSMEFFTLYLLVILSFTLFMVMFGEYSIYLTKVLNDLEARKTAIIIARSANMVVFSGNGSSIATFIPNVSVTYWPFSIVVENEGMGSHPIMSKNVSISIVDYETEIRNENGEVIIE